VQETSGDSVYLVLKAKKHSNKNIIDGSQVSTGQSSAISQGAKFEYRSIHGREFLSSRGPLLGSIMIGLSGSGEGEVKVKYVIRAKEDTLSSRHRYEWQTRGWSRCSKDCGGGLQKLVIRCYNSESGERMRRQHCGAKRNRPKTEKRKCNNFACASSWVSGEWEDCNSSCGKLGIQTRDVFCLPMHINKTDQLWKNMVDVGYCANPKPVQIRECSRVLCPAVWSEIGWGPCSVSCGQGFKIMLHRCTVPGYNACGPRPIQIAACSFGNCATLCGEDKSPVCMNDEMMRYCQLKKYRDRCCVACSS